MVLHGFTWMFYELCLFLQSIGMVLSASGWQTLTRLRMWVVPKATTGEGIKTSLHSLSKTQPADHASDSVGFLGCLFHVLDNRNGSTFRCKSPRSLPGKVGFMCWIICKHKWAKCKRNEFGLCIWVWIVGYDALPWKIRDLNTVLGLKLSKSVFQNANRHALDPFSSDS